jgi:type II secretory pathway component GspD/PulD (secretin)
MKIILEISSIVEYEAVTGQPRIRTRKVETFLKLNDSETSILGGLISEEERIGSSSLPYIGGIPIIGNFFSSERKEKVETDVLMLITPRIVRPVEPISDEYKNIKSGTRKNFEGE